MFGGGGGSQEVEKGRKNSSWIFDFPCAVELYRMVKLNDPSNLNATMDNLPPKNCFVKF